MSGDVTVQHSFNLEIWKAANDKRASPIFSAGGSYCYIKKHFNKISQPNKCLFSVCFSKIKGASLTQYLGGIVANQSSKMAAIIIGSNIDGEI